jgi:hypothetical protein
VIALRSTRYAPRVAGFAFLFLIMVVLASGVPWNAVRRTDGIADTLASISEHASSIRVGLLLSIVGAITTLVLAGMLYAILVAQDRNLAVLALACRAVEAGLYAVGMFDTLALLSMSNGSPNDSPSVAALANLLMDARWMGTNIGAIFFAAGSTIYCYLLLTARSIPVPLAATGLVGSLIILVGVPLQTAFSVRTFTGASALIWFPIGIFEISTGVWLLVKGAAVKATDNTRQ